MVLTLLRFPTVKSNTGVVRPPTLIREPSVGHVVDASGVYDARDAYGRASCFQVREPESAPGNGSCVAVCLKLGSYSTGRSCRSAVVQLDAVLNMVYRWRHCF